MRKLPGHYYVAMNNARLGNNIYNQRLAVVLKEIRGRFPDWIRIGKPRLDPNEPGREAYCFAKLTAAGEKILQETADALPVTAGLECNSCGAITVQNFSNRRQFERVQASYRCDLHR